MCTAISYKTKNHYFGRNLDLERSYGERVVIMPRRFPLVFRRMPKTDEHYAMIGVAAVVQGVPLFYDATNEKGLSAAGLNFPESAVYHPERQNRDNIAPFELIPWLLGQCASVDEACVLLEQINIADIHFSAELPNTPLHWLIADSERSAVLEPMEDGLRIYRNPPGVLTNSPPFDYHMKNLCNYMSLSPCEPHSSFSSELPLRAYSRGMGALGMPGDLSSASRFVRAAFTKLNSVSGESEEESISQFFHILGSVEQQRGCVRLGEKRNEYEITVYSSCCNTESGVYYYTTYENRSITAVDMHREDLDAEALAVYPLITEQRITRQN